MSVTYDKIQTTTLGSAQASVTFSAISGSYTDLVLISNVDITSAGASINIRFNSDTGNNYSYITIYGNGIAHATNKATNQNKSYIAAYVAPNTSLETVIVTNIQNYSNTTTNKTLISRSNRASASNSPGAEVLSGLWRNTSAITSITLAADSGNIDTGSTFTLYGIKAE
jgi:hypothetical protein